MDRLKIVWGVDVFDRQIFNDIAFPAVMQLYKHFAPEIYPVYVLGPAGDAVLPETLSDEMDSHIDTHHSSAVKAIQTLLGRLPDGSYHSPEVLVEPSSSTKRAVSRLCNYALQIDADVALVCTHSRTSVGRFMKGDFTGTLIKLSSSPVLVYRKPPINPIRRIVVPIDFGQNSYSLFLVAKKNG